MCNKENVRVIINSILQNSARNDRVAICCQKRKVNIARMIARLRRFCSIYETLSVQSLQKTAKDSSTVEAFGLHT